MNDNSVIDLERHIPIAGAFNIRDVGGYPAAGGAIRWRTLFRGDSLHRIDPVGAARLAEIGLRTVVDIRERFEQEARPDVLDGTDIEVVSAPFIGRKNMHEGAVRHADLAAQYAYLVNERADKLVGVIHRVSDPVDYPLLVHCASGKDRTGVVIALILSAIGVPDELVAADYALSATYVNTSAYREVLRAEAAADGGEQPRDEMMRADANVVADLLRDLSDAYGSTRHYLVAHGLGEESLRSLEHTLVEKAEVR